MNHHDSMEWTTEELKKLSSRYCVSQEVRFRRLLTLGKTELEAYLSFREGFKNLPTKKRSQGDYYRNVVAKNGRLFLNLALQSYHQEKITASSLYDYTQVKPSNLLKLEQRLYA